MNKENVLTKKLNSSPWKSPKANKIWKEQLQNSSEKRGLHVKSISDNNIIETGSQKSDSSLSFIREDYSFNQEQIIQQLIKKIEFYEGFLTKSQIQEGEKYVKQSTYKNYSKSKNIFEYEATTPNSKELNYLKKENKSLQERLTAALKKNDELTNSLIQAEDRNTRLNEDYLSIKKEKDELVSDIGNLNDVVNMLVERENWIPPEELEEKIKEALIEEEKEEEKVEEKVEEKIENKNKNSKVDASNDSLSTLVSSATNSKDNSSEHEIMINDLKKQIENLTLALNEKSEALEKKESETKELYEEIKEYHEVFDALKERENWISPEEVEEIRGELYDVVIQKGFIETELKEKKELIEELKKRLLE